MRQLAKLAILVMICTSVFAQQKRVEMGWNGNDGYTENETPSISRPLDYYISNQRRQEFLSDAGGCAIPSECNDTMVRISQTEIGAPLGERTIQILYAMPGEYRRQLGTQLGAQSYWKSIVIEPRPGMYRELLLLKSDAAWLWPPEAPEIVTAGATTLLVDKDHTDSSEMGCTGEVWVLGKAGAELAGFSDVVAAVKKTVPSGDRNVSPLCSGLDLGKSEFRGDVQETNPKCMACGWEGHVVVRFGFEGARAVPISATFQPESE
ncbi:MAG TPA: hypothetical protein VME18_01880 [Acidobacteriaceae bacterium]|nr:hypothetical protein [Acidobacteriaceae bacterium]